MIEIIYFLLSAQYCCNSTSTFHINALLMEMRTLKCLDIMSFVPFEVVAVQHTSMPSSARVITCAHLGRCD